MLIRCLDRDIFSTLDGVAKVIQFCKKLVNILDFEYEPVDFVTNFFFPRYTALLVLPFVVSDSRSFSFGFIERLNTEGKAYPVGNFFYLIKRFLVGIEFLAVNAVGIYDDVVVYVSLVNVGRNNDLTIITERFSCKCSAYLVCERVLA